MSLLLLRSRYEIWAKLLHEYREVEMAGFNAYLELGRIARELRVIQSKKLMWGIKGIYLSGLQLSRNRDGLTSELWNRDRGRSPLVNWMLATTIEALCCWVLCTTVRTNGARFKRIEALATLTAFPIRSDWRSGIAGWACESRATWQFRHPQQSLGLFKPRPAVHCHEEGNRSQPKRMSPDC